jgi:DNA polymerase-3 subunit gamma/tau
MALLRMLAFRPDAGGGAPAERPATAGAQRAPAPTPARAAAPVANERMHVSSVAEAPRAAPPVAAAPVAPREPVARDAAGLPHWDSLIEQANLRGPLGQLAQNAALRGREGATLVLALQPAHMHLAVEPMVSQMEERISQALGERVKLRFTEERAAAAETPAARAANAREAAQSAAEQAIDEDPLVQSLKREFGARVVPQSIKPFEN